MMCNGLIEQEHAYRLARILICSVATTRNMPFAPRQQRCEIMVSVGCSGGVHDMETIARGETWEKAFVKAMEWKKENPNG